MVGTTAAQHPGQVISGTDQLLTVAEHFKPVFEKTVKVPTGANCGKCKGYQALHVVLDETCTFFLWTPVFDLWGC